MCGLSHSPYSLFNLFVSIYSAVLGIELNIESVGTVPLIHTPSPVYEHFDEFAVFFIFLSYIGHGSACNPTQEPLSP